MSGAGDGPQAGGPGRAPLRPAPKPVRLKDGRAATLRAARLDDAPDLLEIDRAVAAADIGVVRAPAELPATTREKQADLEEWITGARSGEAGCLLVIEINGRVVAEGSIRRIPRQRIQHVAHIGLSVHPEWQELGMGRAIMTGLIEWARSRRDKRGRPGVTRIDLFVLADNPRAIALYRSLGFVEEGTRRNYIRREDGSYVDDLLMALLI